MDAGTGDIPPVFYWEQNYKIFPGKYSLYYEGSIWTGMAWGFYAWEVEYKINEVAGEPGGWYYNGQDGPDNYFMIECSPYGPYIGSSYKDAVIDSKYEVLETSDSEITVKQAGDGIEILITYKKVESRNEIMLNEN